ncbi:MAG: HAD family phosphatase [Planctomycetaceae bacterium]|nr:HAD family phosphatase [Planctomycetaceae bacterium]
MSLLKPLVARGRTIRAVVFDMDGLMFNTEDLYDLVGQQMLARRGHQFDLELKLRMMGRTASVAFEIMRQACNLTESIEELKRENDRLFMALLETQLEKLPGLDVLMTWIAQRNLPLGLATSSRRFLAEYKLQRFGLTPHFRAIVTGDEVKHGKPDPEIYLAVAKQLNVAPNEMLAFEDSVVGSTAAAAAGAFTVAVPGKHGEQLDYSHVDLITNRLDSPAIQELFAESADTV